MRILAMFFGLSSLLLLALSVVNLATVWNSETEKDSPDSTYIEAALVWLLLAIVVGVLALLAYRR